MPITYVFNGKQVPEPKANQYAVDKNGKMFHISEADHSDKDGYFCSHCGENLTMNLGEKKAHHFSHRRNSGCGGAETELHLQCKELLGYTNSDKNEEYTYRFGLPCFRSKLRPDYNINRQIGTVENVRIEEAIYLDGKMYRPDILVDFYPNKKKYPQIFFPLAIEIRHKNPVDVEKQKAFRKAKFACIEVDMRGFNFGVDDKDKMDLLFKKWLDNKTWIQEPSSEEGFRYEVKELSQEQKYLIQEYSSIQELSDINEQRMQKYNQSLSDPKMKHLSKTTNLQVSEEYDWLDMVRDYDHHFESPTFEYRAAILIRILGKAVKRNSMTIGVETLHKEVKRVCSTYERYEKISPYTLRQSGVPASIRNNMPDFKIGVRGFMKECEEKGLVTYQPYPREQYVLHAQAINALCETINPILEKNTVVIVLEEEIRKMQCVKSKADKKISNSEQRRNSKDNESIQDFDEDGFLIARPASISEGKKRTGSAKVSVSNPDFSDFL